ncbi:hypothetical protein P154DRAFT_36530 [Amniculicola lignicola CBS 123094]|uniref:RING-type E3 ubiquitin transferase n=1 Tax=Amniculicola lignicola CBS 123094 TaxID=1392246 RepID=A0A6A5X049_9PLEO|nr:hypothetical protein P154DRAFT_36530 [Amniculicola lignicola CBS 123094]
MEQSRAHSQPPPRVPAAQTPARRDTMFCHKCQDEWYRDEHGLTCPACGSDFTEIVEEDNDPRDVHIHDHSDDTESMPDLEEAPAHLNPFAHHNPWRDAGHDADDPEETDISQLRYQQVAPGRFTVTGTVYRTMSPSGAGRGNPNVGGFASMLNNIIGAQIGQMHTVPPQNDEAERQQSGSGTTPAGHRFHYQANARLFPRDANHAGPQIEPVDEMSNVLAGLMAAFGEPPGGPRAAQNHDPYAPPAHPLNPLLAMLTGFMPGGNAAAGDFVYSQEALDRVISQLMEQTSTSNAPGPAPQSDIDALPRKHVSMDMLGPEGRAECSICMDEVNIGEEVTELPCHHWFHHGCVAMWLAEHDTCPHCRQGISEHSENAGGTTAGGAATASHGAATATQNPQNANTGSRSMPGAFDVEGDGSLDHPFVVPSASPEQRRG